MKEEKKEQRCREEEPFLTSCSDSARALYKSMLEYKRDFFGIRFFAGDVYTDLGTVRPDSQQFLLIRIDESGAEAFFETTEHYRPDMMAYGADPVREVISFGKCRIDEIPFILRNRQGYEEIKNINPDNYKTVLRSINKKKK